ncbi:MAG: SurA N-terminal domain-containing protein [Kiritimatiellia bacterium]
MVIQQFNRLIKNKWVWGVFAVAISAFFAFDFLFTGRDDEGRASATVGTLGDRDVTAREFNALTGDARGFGRGRDTRSSNAEINRRAWQACAALQVAKAAHMEATDDEVRAAIRRDPSFRGEGGAFSLRVYETLLRENGMTPEMFEAFLKRRLTLNKLSQVVLGSATWVSPTELEGAINDVTDKFTVRIAAFNDQNAGKVTVDDKAIEAYYKDNTNSIALPDCVKVKYVRFQADVPARLAGFKISDDELHEHYDATASRFETTGTNGVTVTKTFEEVKPILERELQLIASVEAYRTNLLFRVYPQDAAAAPAPADGKRIDRLERIAAEEKAKVETSKRFSLDGRFVKGFMTRASAVAPGVSGFAQAVAELDYESEDLRYGVVAGTNAVYLIELAGPVEKAHVPPFAEAKEIIRPDALADARAKAFKADVEKARALLAADLAAGKPFDAKKLAGANVSTSIVFSVAGLQRDAFPDSMYVGSATMKLAKGKLSDFIPTANPRRGLVVYVENREPGDAAQAQMVRSQLRDELGQFAATALPSAWNEWNLARLGFTTSSLSSVDEPDESPVFEE